MKTAFVCDSTLQVNEEFCKNYPLSIVPLEVRLDDELYEDNVTITPEEFYKKINDKLVSLAKEFNELKQENKDILEWKKTFISKEAEDFGFKIDNEWNISQIN